MKPSLLPIHGVKVPLFEFPARLEPSCYLPRDRIPGKLPRLPFQLRKTLVPSKRRTRHRTLVNPYSRLLSTPLLTNLTLSGLIRKTHWLAKSCPVLASLGKMQQNIRGCGKWTLSRPCDCVALKGTKFFVSWLPFWRLQ